MPAPASSPPDDVDLSRLTVAVVGYGSIGRRHCENLARLGVGKRVLVRRPVGANPAFNPPADVCVVYDHRAAIDLGLHLAIVANPTSLHIDTALDFLNAGVPVLIEKPLAPRWEDVVRLTTATAPDGPFRGMAYCTRYHPAYRLAREALLAGRIGPPCYAKAWFESYLPAWHPWEDYRQSYAARAELGGGVLPTLDHDIDYFNWCFGTPQRVDGWTRRTGALDAPVDDLAALTVEYADGLSATHSMSLCRRDRRRGFEIVGRAGSLRFEMEQGQLLVCGDDPRTAEVLWGGTGYDLNEMYVAMLADVLRAAAVSPHGSPPIPLQAGIEALRMVGQVNR